MPTATINDAKVKVVAHDGAGNSGEGESENIFAIDEVSRKVYDFSQGAGVDKWGWGYQTANWSAVNGNRYPVSTPVEQLKPLAFTQLAQSDATGGDNDANRYTGKLPTNTAESTHVFEFVIAEHPAQIRDIEILWEGYGDACSQMEVYVWNKARRNWGDGTGTTGENRYMQNYAGNNDRVCVGHIRENFADYVDAEGKLTLLLYEERPGDKVLPRLYRRHRGLRTSSSPRTPRRSRPPPGGR